MSEPTAVSRSTGSSVPAGRVTSRVAAAGVAATGPAAAGAPASAGAGEPVVATGFALAEEETKPLPALADGFEHAITIAKLPVRTISRFMSHSARRPQPWR